MHSDDKDELIKVFDALSWQVVVADAFRKSHKGLLSELQVRTVALVAPTFFRMTLAAMYDTASLSLARIFDNTKATIRLLHFLDVADKVAGTFKHASPEKVRSIVKENRTKINAAQSLLTPLRARRNKMLAHLSEDIILSPQAVEEETATTDAEWENLISTASEILNEVRVAFDGLVFSGPLLDWDDYKNLVHVVREGKKKQILDYERDFGAWYYPEQKEDLGI